MNEQDKAIVAEHDAVMWEMSALQNADRWRHAGRTIRRYRDWWVQTQGALDIIADLMHRYHRRCKWEKRRADRWRARRVETYIMQRQAEREASAFAAHVQKLATELLECRAARDALRARCERMEGLIVEACDDQRNWVSTAWYTKARAAIKEEKP